MLNPFLGLGLVLVALGVFSDALGIGSAKPEPKRDASGKFAPTKGAKDGEIVDDPGTPKE